MKEIKNLNGMRYIIANNWQWLAIVQMMDGKICESLHSALAPCSEQEFFDAYAKAHQEKYGETWELAKPNPVW